MTKKRDGIVSWSQANLSYPQIGLTSPLPTPQPLQRYSSHQSNLRLLIESRIPLQDCESIELQRYLDSNHRTRVYRVYRDDTSDPPLRLSRRAWYND